MKKLLLALLIFFVAPLQAQTRWCDVAVPAKPLSVTYPPIARAAHIAGTVIGRIQFLPTGKVQTFETVSGPYMLSKAVEEQAKSWIVQTTSIGREPCQNLVIVTFTIGDQKPPYFGDAHGLVQISVHAEEVVLYSSPSYRSGR